MTDATSFSDIQLELESRVRRIVWCTLATVDTKGRPRVRIVHPVWEGPNAYICTGRHSLKEKHLAKNPFVALSYWDPQHQQVYAECRCQWIDHGVATQLKRANGQAAVEAAQGARRRRVLVLPSLGGRRYSLLRLQRLTPGTNS